MSAVGLFDLLASDSKRNHGGAGSMDKLAHLAETLVAGTLAILEQLREGEQDLGAGTTDHDLDLKISRSIWQLYQEWADEAEQVLARARSLKGAPVTGADRLDDAIGRILARLSVTPEQIARAKQQVREGQFVPAKELRDELHARLRA